MVLRTDPTQDSVDRYGRLLAYATTRAGVSLQERQLRAGWAMVYVYDHTPFQQVRAFRHAQRGARRAGLGVWGKPATATSTAPPRRTRPNATAAPYRG